MGLDSWYLEKYETQQKLIRMSGPVGGGSEVRAAPAGLDHVLVTADLHPCEEDELHNEQGAGGRKVGEVAGLEPGSGCGRASSAQMAKKVHKQDACSC